MVVCSPPHLKIQEIAWLPPGNKSVGRVSLKTGTCEMKRRKQRADSSQGYWKRVSGNIRTSICKRIKYKQKRKNATSPRGRLITPFYVNLHVHLSLVRLLLMRTTFRMKYNGQLTRKSRHTLQQCIKNTQSGCNFWHAANHSSQIPTVDGKTQQNGNRFSNTQGKLYPPASITF